MILGFLVPSRGQIPTILFKNWLETIKETEKAGHTVVPIFNDQTASLDIKRNNLAEEALFKGCDKVVFMDDDVLFRSTHDLTALIEQDKDIITGLLCGKNKPYLAMVLRGEKDHWNYYQNAIKHTEPFEVDRGGAAMLVISRKALETVGQPWFKWGYGQASEDCYFYEKAKEAGFKIWCDPRVIGGHISQVTLWADEVLRGPDALKYPEWKKVEHKQVKI